MPINTTSTLIWSFAIFFGLEGSRLFHMGLRRFISGSRWKTQTSSPVCFFLNVRLLTTFLLKCLNKILFSLLFFLVKRTLRYKSTYCNPKRQADSQRLFDRSVWITCLRNSARLSHRYSCVIHSSAAIIWLLLPAGVELYSHFNMSHVRKFDVNTWPAGDSMPGWIHWNWCVRGQEILDHHILRCPRRLSPVCSCDDRQQKIFGSSFLGRNRLFRFWSHSGVSQ